MVEILLLLQCMALFLHFRYYMQVNTYCLVCLLYEPGYIPCVDNRKQEKSHASMSEFPTGWWISEVPLKQTLQTF
jgi:hypothetical protein